MVERDWNQTVTGSARVLLKAGGLLKATLPGWDRYCSDLQPVGGDDLHFARHPRRVKVAELCSVRGGSVCLTRF